MLCMQRKATQRHQQQLKSWVTGKSRTFQKLRSGQNIENFLTFSQSLSPWFSWALLVMFSYSLCLFLTLTFNKTFRCLLSLFLSLSHSPNISMSSVAYPIALSTRPSLSQFLSSLSLSLSLSWSSTQYISSFKSKKSRNLFIVLWRLVSFLLLPSDGPTCPFVCVWMCGFPNAGFSLKNDWCEPNWRQAHLSLCRGQNCRFKHRAWFCIIFEIFYSTIIWTEKRGKKRTDLFSILCNF